MAGIFIKNFTFKYDEGFYTEGFGIWKAIFVPNKTSDFECFCNQKLLTKWFLFSLNRNSFVDNFEANILLSSERFRLRWRLLQSHLMSLIIAPGC